MELLMRTPYISAGVRFNMLTAKSDCLKSKEKYSFICDCGVAKEILAYYVRSGRTKSCGCLLSEHNRRQSSADPMKDERRYTYRSWEAMIARCMHIDHPYYERYGGRGITVTAEWLSFDSFLADMGYRPRGLVLDRVDNDLGYNKDNCRWTTQRVNTRNRGTFNRIITAFGESKTIAEWSEDERCKTNSNNLYKRIQGGWAHERAISTPTDTRFQPNSSA